MLNIVQGACMQFLQKHQDFSTLAALTERSFEEGERNRAFRESIDWYEKAGLSQELAAKLRMGINRNLVELLARAKGAPPNIEYNPTRSGKRPDICFGHRSDGTATIEVKVACDTTLAKYYPIIIGDGEKLRRLAGSPGHAIQVVFFVQLPGFDYPPGSWYVPGSKQCPARGGYPGYRGIAAQYQAVRRGLPPPSWPGDEPYIADLTLSDPDLEAIITRWFQMIFRPATLWRFDKRKHLEDAAVGCAIWQHRMAGDLEPATGARRKQRSGQRPS
jgi:hypothetical protein